MKRPITPIFTALLMGLLLTGCRTTENLYQGREKSIVVLYENDVHCNIDGYAKLAGMRDAVADTAWTCIVSSGDFLQGGTAGAISKGHYIVDIMKHVGYDALTLGNHEFDYKMEPMFRLLRDLGAPVTSANLFDTSTNKRVYAPYVMKKLGNRKVAFIGATTPTTLDTEAYAFYDEKGNEVKYDLMSNHVYALVQQCVDEVRSKGADYVVMLTHIGEDKNSRGVDSHGLISQTTGIDVVLDAHTHSVVPGTKVLNKEGKPVIISQTGTKFTNIGKLVIMPDGHITTTLLPTKDIGLTNQRVQEATDKVKSEMQATTSRLICQSDVDLRILNDAGKQEVRMGETNAGDIVADAFRIMTGSDIAMTNGGGIRTQLKAGQLTYGDIVSMLPYDNYLCVLKVTGQKIIEVLKENTQLLPHEDGQFPQVSGLKFTAVAADHSIRDVMVLNPTTQVYEPIDPSKTYTLTTTDYCITGGGFRNTLKEAEMQKEAVMIYNESLVQYVTQKLNGHIGNEYARPQGRITVMK